MITKLISNNQLFVYHNGKLIYKRWLKTGISAVFQKYGQVEWNKGGYL
jgi:hypothetical protein